MASYRVTRAFEPVTFLRLMIFSSGFAQRMRLEMAYLFQVIAIIAGSSHQPLGVLVVQFLPPQAEEQGAVLHFRHELLTRPIRPAHPGPGCRPRTTARQRHRSCSPRGWISEALHHLDESSYGASPASAAPQLLEGCDLLFEFLEGAFQLGADRRQGRVRLRSRVRVCRSCAGLL